MRFLRAGLMLLLGWFGFEASNVRAQLEFNGGYVQTRRDRSKPVDYWGFWGSRSPILDSESVSISYSPDGDTYYPSFLRASLRAMRSAYYPGKASASSSSLQTVKARSAPRYFSLEATANDPLIPLSGSAPATLIVRLPEGAELWIEGKPIAAASTRPFVSPPLSPLRKYFYEVRADWIEEGRRVSQSRKVAVRAGAVETIFLRRIENP